jgi:AraC-like DNA-binding protein
MAALSHCSEYQLLSSVRLQSFDDDISLEQINSIVNQLTDNIAQAPSMSEFAAQFGMTESRFSRFFRRATGNNFIDFVNRVRISRACLLLMDSNRYITHICYDVGFNNVANFNRRFLEIKGMTPSEFRRHASRRFGD